MFMLAIAVSSLQGMIIYSKQFELAGKFLRENLDNLMQCIICISSNFTLHHGVKQLTEIKVMLHSMDSS